MAKKLDEGTESPTSFPSSPAPQETTTPPEGKRFVCPRCGWMGTEAEAKDGGKSCPTCSTHKTRPAHNTLKPLE